MSQQLQVCLSWCCYCSIICGCAHQVLNHNKGKNHIQSVLVEHIFILMRQKKKKKGYEPQSFEFKSSTKSLGLRLQVEKDNFSLSLSLVFPSGIIIGAIVIKTAFT